MGELFFNIGITGLCLLGLGFYFNFREKSLRKIADTKFDEIKGKYFDQVLVRKIKERKEIERLKKIVEDLEVQHKKVLHEKRQFTKKYNPGEAEKLIRDAEDRAKQIEAEVKENAQRFLEDQKREVQTKMVDLVMGVTKRVLIKSLTYEEHKELIESAMLELEGEIADERSDR